MFQISGTAPPFTGLVIAQQSLGKPAANIVLLFLQNSAYGSTVTVYTVPASRVAIITAYVFAAFNNGGSSQGYLQIAGGNIGANGNQFNSDPQVPIILTAGQTIKISSNAGAGASIIATGIEEDA